MSRLFGIHAIKQLYLFILIISVISVVAQPTEATNDNKSQYTIKTLVENADIYKIQNMAIGKDRLPVITYYKNDGSYNLLKCKVKKCGKSKLKTIYKANTTSDNLSAQTVVGSDNKPVTVYSEYDDKSINVIKCQDKFCNDIYSTIVGYSSSSDPSLAIAIGTDGNPIIAYTSTSSSKEVIIVKCAEENCIGYSTTTTSNTNSTNDSNNFLITVDAENIPTIAYKTSDDDIEFIFCEDTTCSGSAIKTFETSSDDVKSLSLVATDNHNYPIFSYIDNATNKVQLVNCVISKYCGVYSYVTTIDTGGYETDSVALTIGKNTYPLMAFAMRYEKDGPAILKTASCAATNCPDATIITTTVDTYSNANYPMIGKAKKRKTVLAYRDYITDALKFAYGGTE